MTLADSRERLVVFTADTWLHLTTKTVTFVQVSPVEAVTNYSLALDPKCTINNNSFAAQVESYCSIDHSSSINFFNNGTQSLQVLNNISGLMTVFIYESNPPCTYLGVPLSDGLSRTDYTATTFGMNTNYKPVSNECNLNEEVGAFTPFKCGETFQGDLTWGPSWQMAYFTNSAMTSNDTPKGIYNSYYFGLAAREISGGPTGLTATNLIVIPEIVTPSHGGVSFVLFCSVTVYDVEYDSVNGTVTRFVTRVSNHSVANAWQGSMAIVTGAVGQANLQQKALLGILSNTAQQLADTMASAYSQVALAVSAQVLRPSPALAV
jgi:hypothetical protein